jgi:hypothetical protein
MKTIKVTTTGKSLKELREKYGTGSSGFYTQDWYENEKFFTEKPEARYYELIIDEIHTGKTFADQIGSLPGGFVPTHPAIIAEIILGYFKDAGERLFENVWLRSNTLVSDGYRVNVGGFGPDGLSVNLWDDDIRNDSIGVSGCRLVFGTLRV